MGEKNTGSYLILFLHLQATIILFSLDLHIFCKFSAISLLILLLIRLKEFYHQGKILYFVDFCYVTNFSVIILLLFNIQSDFFFQSISILASQAGLASLVYKCGACFTRLDVYTGFYIHWIPIFVVYAQQLLRLG